MKKLLPFAPFLAAGAGVAGALLRRWMLTAGTDLKGLYPAAHPGWIGYLVLTAAAILAFWLLTRSPEDAPKPLDNFYLAFSSKALTAAVHLLAAIGIALHATRGSGLLQTVTYFLALACAGGLTVLGLQIFSGKAPTGTVYLLPCVFFAMQLFVLGRQCGDETQLSLFMPQSLAIAASSLAGYRLWGAAIGCDDRRKRLFWSLTAGFLCLAAAPGAHVMYAAVGLWHLAGYRILPPPETAAETEEASEAITEEATEEPIEEHTEEIPAEAETEE